MTAMQLRWLASVSVSSLHAAEAAARGLTLVDPALNQAMAEPAAALQADIESLALPEETWPHLLALAAGIENDTELAEVVLRKVRGSSSRADAAVSRLAARIGDIEAAGRQAIPDLISQLELRSRPLREQWEARGPGLLRSLARRTDERLLVERADVVLVHPATGGGGQAHLLYNSVRLEAVLANPLPELPETVRLGWLLAQLNLELPLFSESIHGHRLPRVAELAMLPAVLAAAEDVELARYDRATLEKALAAWRLVGHASSVPTHPARPFNPAPLLWDWWTTYQADRTPWPVALRALDQLLLA